MSPEWGAGLGIYLVGLLFAAVFGYVFMTYPVNNKDVRMAARVMMLGPVWPLLVPYLLYVVYRYLWRKAEWGKK